MSAHAELSRLEEHLRVLRAQQGDREAFDRLVDSYERRVLYFILRFVDDADEALDVLQEVWLAVFRLLPTLHSPEAFRVWLYRIARGKAVDLIRRRQPGVLSNASAGQIDAAVVDDAPPALENVELVHAALERLSLEHREVLTLCFLENMRLEEVAEVLACPLGTVKSRMHYAKIAFRKQVEELVDG